MVTEIFQHNQSIDEIKKRLRKYDCQLILLEDSSFKFKGYKPVMLNLNHKENDQEHYVVQVPNTSNIRKLKYSDLESISSRE